MKKAMSEEEKIEKKKSVGHPVKNELTDNDVLILLVYHYTT